MFKFSIRRVAALIVFATVLCVCSAGLIECIFPSESAVAIVRLFTKDEAAEVVEELRQVPEYTTKLLDVTHGVSSGSQLTPEGQTLAASKPHISQSVQGKKPPEYNELGNFAHPFMQRISARDMAKLIAYLKQSGGYTLVTTQELGNCLWASVLRGTNVKQEFTSMHLRRLVAKMIGAFPQFFFDYLKFSLASLYGQDRPSEEEIAQKEKEGTITAEQAHDYRLPGPFSFADYVQHIITDGTWGDDHILTLISLLWQVKITVLNASTLGETRIRHDDKLADAELVLVLIGGDHYMGTGEYAGLINYTAGLIILAAGLIPQRRFIGVVGCVTVA